MTLDKPINENCGNCYYCISRFPKYDIPGLEEYEKIEIFSCHRRSQWQETRENEWCGEWKSR